MGDTTSPSREQHDSIAPIGAVRLAVFVSGSGRTFEGLAAEAARGSIPCAVALVVASRDCEGEGKARAAGVPTVVLPGEIDAASLERVLRSHRIDAVALAGYLRRVHVPPAYAGRIVNIHPSLLPRHGGQGMYGLRVHEAVLAAGDRESGCTVHEVDGVYDRGRVLLQRRCPVLPGDTPATLAARVFDLEREAYPAALREWIVQLPPLAGVQPVREASA